MRQVLIVCSLGVAVLVGQAVVVAQGGDANKILASAREALGGDKKLAAVKTFTASGQTKRSMGQFQMAGDFEVNAELPDKYIRRENISIAGMSISNTAGFNGHVLLQEMSAPQMGGMVMRMGAGGLAGASMTPEQQAQMTSSALLSTKQDFTRLTIGIFAASFSSYPLEFSFAGQAESPDGTADILEVKGEGDFAMRLLIDSKTHMPLLAMWEAPDMQMALGGLPGNMGQLAGAFAGRAGATGATGATGAPGARGAGAAPQATGGRGQAMTPEEQEKMRAQLQARLQESQSKKVEHRLYLSDYRSVDGIKVPFRVVHAVAGQPFEETTFEKFKTNQKIDAKKFEVSK